MSATVEWFCIEPGVYRGRYQGRLLEIVRNDDVRDKRRYVCAVDGTPISQPCWTIPQAKTKLIQHVNRTPTFERPERPEHQEIIPYEAPEPTVPAVAGIEMTYTITGTMRVPDFGAGWSHLTTTIEMLREWGEADGEAVPPSKVRF